MDDALETKQATAWEHVQMGKIACVGLNQGQMNILQGVTHFETAAKLGNVCGYVYHASIIYYITSEIHDLAHAKLLCSQAFNNHIMDLADADEPIKLKAASSSKLEKEEYETWCDLQYCAGWMYRHGCGVDTDEDLALAKCMRAPEHSFCQLEIGFIHLYLFKNPNDAFLWFLKSARQGNAIAQRMTGVHYAYHIGLGNIQRKNEANNKANIWYLNAARQGCLLSLDRLWQNLINIHNEQCMFWGNPEQIITSVENGDKSNDTPIPVQLETVTRIITTPLREQWYTFFIGQVNHSITQKKHAAENHVKDNIGRTLLNKDVMDVILHCLVADFYNPDM